MLNARARNIVTSSEPDQTLAFLVEVAAGSGLSDAKSITNAAERRTAIRAFYSQMKAPVINVLHTYSKDGIEVVNNLDGTLQFIAAGPAEAWEKAILEHKELFDSPAVSLIPNDAVAFVY
ncbi:hypothetical protein [Pararhizobium sp.]|uniref:hypothetical protein n=1 Tax=Pararhizobium sp. TaxID=1977563 RepID=UPI002724CADA|nr:hypothetical protein [Pararhizobium sp.]MDO9417185.1 hypothetical protein [Pararhizobium sp.]